MSTWLPCQPHEMGIPEAAQRLGCDQVTVWRAVQTGELPAYRVGPGARTIRILRTDFDAFVRARIVAAEKKIAALKNSCCAPHGESV